MALTEKRRNEIAWLALVYRTRKQGLPHFKTNEFRREIRNNAKEIGVSVEEAAEFARALIMPLVEEMFELPKKDDGHNFRDGVESGPSDD